MVKSSPAELRLLRDVVFERDAFRCVWPGCTNVLWSNLQLAHLTHRGMGGSKERNTPENCVTLCSVHHDCLDGRTGLGTLRWELNEMMRFTISQSAGQGGATQ